MQSRVMEKSKILYNLDEILQNGYSIKTKIPEETRCKYCNKVLKPRGILNPISKTINVFIENEKCDCKQAIEERDKAKEKLQEELMIQYEKFRKEELNKKIKQYYGTDFITAQFKQKTLENFITNEQNSRTKLAAEKFISDFKNFKNGIIFEGKSGTGKTHISMAICNELLKENTPIIFGTLTELVDKYAKFYTNHTESELTNLYTKVDLLVIDNLGVEPMNDWLLAKLFTIINERILNELPYIITTNYNMETLKERLSIPNKVCETPNSIISRLSNMCYRIQCK